MKKEISSKYQEWGPEIGNDEAQWNRFVEDFYREEWDKLDNNEKAICMNYQSQLTKIEKPSARMVKVINEIHAKYPDFHLGCLPKRKKTVQAGRVLDFPKQELRTMDYSNFLPGEKA